MYSKRDFKWVKASPSGAKEESWLLCDSKNNRCMAIITHSVPSVGTTNYNGEYYVGWWHEDAFNKFWGNDLSYAGSFRTLEDAKWVTTKKAMQTTPPEVWKK